MRYLAVGLVGLLAGAGSLYARKASKPAKPATPTAAPVPGPVSAGAKQCIAPGASATSSSDELSGSTYLWQGDDGGMKPTPGSVVRLDFYGGLVDINATKDVGDVVQRWTGKYSVAGGKLTLQVSDMPEATVNGKPYQKSGDQLTLPFAMLEGKSSTWKKSKQQIETRAVKAPCEQQGGRLPSCSTPPKVGYSFGKTCLFLDTTLDGQRLGHTQSCVIDCGVKDTTPENSTCEPCQLAVAGKVAYRNFQALEPKVQKKLADLYGQVIGPEADFQYRMCVATAENKAADQGLTEAAKHGTRAQEDAATKVAEATDKAVAALRKGPERAEQLKQRLGLESKIVELTLAEMIPLAASCNFEGSPRKVPFEYSDEYVAKAAVDLDCETDNPTVGAPTQLSTGMSGQQMFGSSFYTWIPSTGRVFLNSYEDLAAELVHEGFHHHQHACGSAPGMDDTVSAMMRMATEVMTYQWSEQTPFYRYILTSDGRKVWLDTGRNGNRDSFIRLWDHKPYWCRLKKKEQGPDGAALTEAQRQYLQTWASVAYPFMKVKMMQLPADDGGLWGRLCSDPPGANRCQDTVPTAVVELQTKIKADLKALTCGK